MPLIGNMNPTTNTNKNTTTNTNTKTIILIDPNTNKNTNTNTKKRALEDISSNTDDTDMEILDEKVVVSNTDNKNDKMIVHSHEVISLLDTVDEEPGVVFSKKPPTKRAKFNTRTRKAKTRAKKSIKNVLLSEVSEEESGIEESDDSNGGGTTDTSLWRPKKKHRKLPKHSLEDQLKNRKVLISDFFKVYVLAKLHFICLCIF